MKESIKKQKKKKEEDKILIKEEEDKKGLGKKKMHADKLNSLLLTLHDVSCVMCVSRCAFIVFDKISKRKVVNMWSFTCNDTLNIKSTIMVYFS